MGISGYGIFFLNRHINAWQCTAFIKQVLHTQTATDHTVNEQREQEKLYCDIRGLLEYYSVLIAINN